MNRRKEAGRLMAAIEEDPPLWRARLAEITGRPGPGNAARTTSARQRAGGRRTKQLARRRR